MKELQQKVPVLADEAGQVGKMQRRLDAKADNLVVMKQILEAKEAAIWETIYKYGQLE